MNTTELETVRLTVNGKPVTLQIEPHELLIQVLRNRLKLFGTREGCGTGACGACTVLVDGEPVSSCLLLAILADGRSVQTIEGLGQDGHLHPIQEAFLEERAFQCGFCTPGQILSTQALLALEPNPSEETIRDFLAGNLCRCCAYDDLVRAVQNASRRLASRTEDGALV